MKRMLRNMKWLDYLMMFIVSFKVMIFYLVTDMTGYRFATSLITIVAILLISSWVLLSERKGSIVTFGIVYFVVSLLMFADSMYFAYFNQLPSVLQLMQVNAMIVVDADTFKVSLPPLNILLLLDVPFTIIYFKKLNKRIGRRSYHQARKYIKAMLLGMTCMMFVGVINPLNIDAFKIVNQSELMSYHLRDIYEQVISGNSNYIEDDEDLDEVLQELKGRDFKVTSELEVLDGAFEGYNLVVVQLESLQQFVINESYNEIELTPYINQLLKDNTLYFDHYYQTIGRGNTSDAEFTSNNGMYPVIDGGTYTLFEKNEFNGLPWLLKTKGYTSKVYHGYVGEFWNREHAYVNQGFDDYISLEDFELDEKMAFGLSDFSFYKQTLEFLNEDYTLNEQPFHSFLISLSCHYPYRLPQDYSVISDVEDEKFGSLFTNYLSGVRYADQALGEFMTEVKQSEFYEETIFVFYGDHHGLNAKDKDNFLYMSEFLDKDYDYDEMLNIPMFIHIPGLKEYNLSSQTIDKVSGQVDLMPTIAYLMGLETDEINFGHNILSDEEGFVASVTYMPKGSFVKNKVIYEASPTEVFEEGRAWNIETSEEIEDFDYLFNDFVKANRWVEASKYILYNDLIER